MNNDFADWVYAELRDRGWTISELVARGNIQSGSLSNVLSGSRRPGPEMCRRIARGFGIAEEEVFRQAGLLSDLDGDEETTSFTRLTELGRSLTVEQRQEAMEFMRYLRSRGDKRTPPAKS